MDPVVPISKFIANIRAEDIPRHVEASAKRALIDTFGCILAGSSAPGVREIVAQIEEWGGAAQSAVAAFGTRAPAPFAALANGAMAHARDFDDTHDVAGVHSCASVVPAALALAESENVSGADFLAALTLGVDLACRLGLSVERYAGWHLTGICGAFGAAAASAKLLELDAEGVRNALGIVLSQTAGTLQSVVDGAHTKRLHAGFAAQAGVAAAQLAARGVTGAKDVFEGRFGFFHLYGGRKNERTDPAEARQTDGSHEYANEAPARDLGFRYEIEHLSFKPYPCCRASHGVLDGLLEMICEKNIASHDVVKARAHISPWIARLVDRPFVPGESGVVTSQFSLPYHMACALVRGDVFLDVFTEEGIADARVAEVVPRMELVVDASIRHKVPVRVEVFLKSGEVLSTTVAQVRGGIERPMNESELEEKFLKCARFSRPDVDRRSALIQEIYEIDAREDVSGLVSCLL